MGELAKKLEDRKKRVRFDCDAEEPEPNWFVPGNRGIFKNPANATSGFGRFRRRNKTIGSEGDYLALHGLRDALATIGARERRIDINRFPLLFLWPKSEVAICSRVVVD